LVLLRRTLRATLRAAALAAALAPSLPAAAGRAAAAHPAARPSSHSITPAQLEDRHGIRLLQIAVTAAGGLVDLRLKILDPRKAAALLHDPSSAPRLVPDGGGRELQAPHSMTHGLSTRRDAVSYLLFPNVAGSVRPGTHLAVAFGEVRVAPLVAR
jgi:hypothetical protein